MLCVGSADDACGGCTSTHAYIANYFPYTGHSQLDDPLQFKNKR